MCPRNNGKTKNPQSKGKEESSERVLNEIEASQALDIEFKTMVIRKINENYQKLHRKYEEFTANYISIKKDIERINKGQEDSKNTISELGNRINSRLNEAEDRISELEDEVQKTSQKEQEKEKGKKKNGDRLREVQDNMKQNNIHIIGIPEGEEEEQGIEKLFEKVMMGASLI